MARALGVSGDLGLRSPGGCEACHSIGYRGRLAIGEAFLTDESFLRAVADGQGAAQLAEMARESGLAGMARDGFAKAAQGLTTIEEVMAAVHG